MPQFIINTHRFDPYKNFKFRVKWDGKYVAGVSKVGALKRTVEAFAFVDSMHCRISLGIYPLLRAVDFENGFSSRRTYCSCVGIVMWF
jgi:hypothetical protein